MPTNRALCVFVSAVLALLVVGSVAIAADFAPLKSTQIEERLAAAGFDEAQRTAVLSVHDEYVAQFKAAVEGPIAKWQVEVRRSAATLAEGREWQARARTAAQAVDDAEAPLMEAIRKAARPEQAGSADRVVLALGIKRDLMIARALSVDGSGTDTDVLAALAEAKIAPTRIPNYDALASQYLAERSLVARRIRDLSAAIPLRRLEARERFPRTEVPPPPPAEEGKPLDEEAQRLAKQAEADLFQQAGIDWRVNTARWDYAHQERIEAVKKSRELDARTLDAFMPALSMRERLEVLGAWWQDLEIHTFTQGAGPGRVASELGRFSKEQYEAMRTGIDSICGTFISQWWPKARALAVSSSSANPMIGYSSKSDATTPLGAIVDQAVTQLRGLHGAAETTEQLARGEAVPAVPAVADAPQGQTATFTFQIGGGDGAPIELSGDGGQAIMVVQSVGVVGDGQAEGFAIGSDFEISGLEGLVFEMVDGEMLVDIDNADFGFTMARKGSLPKAISFDDVRDVYGASGVNGPMLDAVGTVFEDLSSEEKPLREEYKVIGAGTYTTSDGAFSIGPDNALTPINPADQARLRGQREEVRGRLLAMETTRLDEIGASLVPQEGRAAVAWLGSWRQFESARAAHGTRPMGSDSLNPVRALFDAKPSEQQWGTLAKELGASCADLTARTQAMITAQAALQKASLVQWAVAEGAGNAPAEPTPQALQAHESAAQAMRTAQTQRMESDTATIARLKALLPTEAAQRLQDAWDDQQFARDLKDPTSMATRFESALLLEMPEEAKAKVRDLQSKWAARSRQIRSSIVTLRTEEAAAKSKAEVGVPVPAAKTARTALKAIKFEREELDRATYRELCAALPADAASRIPPLEGGAKTPKPVAAPTAVPTPTSVPSPTPASTPGS